MGLMAAAATAQAAAQSANFNWGPSLSITVSTTGSYTLPGLGFTSPVQDQGYYGLCWDFAAVSALECRYKLTRNDPNYSIELSESQYPAASGEWGGGDPTWFTNYALTNPVVQLSELPFNGYGSNPATGTWPLQSGWQYRGVLPTGYVGGSTAVATVQSMLETYGPVVMSVCAETDFYWPGGSVPTSEGGIDHDITVVGWHNATSADAPQIQADGGYWIIKNSWGSGWGSYGGYGFIPYGFGGSIVAYTGPAYYTGAMATATWQGSGSVWASGSNNWTSGGSAYTWVNQETAAVFNSSTNNNVTISGPAIAHAMIFNPGATGYVFSGGSLTVTAGGITASESVTINSPVTIGASQTWSTAAGKTLTVSGNVSTNVSTLTVGGAGATLISGVVGDGGPCTGLGGALTMQGPGTLTLTSSNTYSGVTTVSGGLMDLTGSGAIALSSSISLVGGRLLLDNSASYNLTNRIPNSMSIVLGGGEMALNGNAAGTVQTVGSLSLQQGCSTITVNPLSSPAGWNTGTFSRSTGAVALVRGPGLGSGGSLAVGQIKFSNTPTLSNTGTGTGVGILPYLFGDNSATGNGTDLVTYNSSYGVCLLSSSQYAGSITSSANVKLSSSPAAISSNTSILALVLTNSGSATQLAINSNKKLTLTSGALLSTGTTANSVTGGTLTFGNNSATGYEGVVYTASNLTIGSAVTNNGSNAVAVTKGGPATLSYSGANTYSGGTTVGNGTLQVCVGGSLVSGGAVTVSGGNSPVFNVSGGTVSSSASGNAFYLGNIAGQTGVVNVSAGSVATTNGSESVTLGDYGTGIWNQTGGTTTIANQFWGANQVGSAGQLNVSGGYVSAGKYILLAQRGAGTLNLSGSGMVTTPWLAMVGWSYSPATATVNLNGGTLAVGGVYENYYNQSSDGQATFNFNGGLLRATASNTAFMQGLDYVYVQSGGALIDTQGFNDTIGQTLQTGVAAGIDGGLTKYGAGTLTLLASNSYTGPTTVYGGLQLGDGSANTASVAGNIALMNSATLTFANPADLSYANSISGTGNLVKTGPGLLTLSGTNTYGGTTTISAGELIFSTSSSAPAAVVLPDITIASGAVLAASGPYTTVSGWLTSGRIAPSSSGTIALTGSSNLAINLNTAGYAGLVVGSIGTNTYSGTFTPAGSTYLLGGAGGTLVMPNNGALVNGGGARNLVVNGGLTLAGSNNYSGGTLLNPPGQLNLNNAAAIGGGALTIAGGTLGNTSGEAITLTSNNAQNWNADFTFAGPNNLSLGSGSVTMSTSRTVTVSAGTLTVGGPIAGAGVSLSMAGTGTLVLVGSNTFNGGLNLNGGVLNFANGYNLGSGTAITFNGSTLQYAAGNSYNMAGRTLNIGAGGGSIDPGTNSSVTLAGALSGTGQLNVLGARTLVYSGTSTAFTGTANLSGGTFTVTAGASLTNLGTASQNGSSNVVWNVNGTLGVSAAYLSPGSGNWGYVSSTVNVNHGGTMTAATMNMSYYGYADYGTSTSTINVAGVLNVSNLLGWAPDGASYADSIQRYVNVNAGGLLNATTIDLSGVGGNSNGYTRQLNLNGGTLANIAGTNLTVDSTTVVTLTGSSTLSIPSSYSMTINGPISGTGSIATTGSGTVIFMGSNSYTGNTTVSGGTLQVTGSLAKNGPGNVYIAQDADGVFGDGSGDAVLTRRVAAGNSYAGLGSTIANLTTGELRTTAVILGGNASAQADVSMAWRTRTAAEKTQAGGGLVSEVLDLTGVAPTVGGGTLNGSHQTDTFVLEMSYDPSSLLTIWGETDAELAIHGGLYLGYLDLGPDGTPGSADNEWIPAVDGNFGGTPDYVGDVAYNSNYFVLGDYGVDTADHVVWAVVDHNSEFAVVPEPSTLALLGVGAIAVLVYALRRRNAAAS